MRIIPTYTPNLAGVQPLPNVSCKRVVSPLGQGDEPMTITIPDGRNLTELMQACYMSAEQGKAIEGSKSTKLIQLHAAPIINEPRASADAKAYQFFQPNPTYLR